MFVLNKRKILKKICIKIRKELKSVRKLVRIAVNSITSKYLDSFISSVVEIKNAMFISNTKNRNHHYNRLSQEIFKTLKMLRRPFRSLVDIDIGYNYGKLLYGQLKFYVSRFITIIYAPTSPPWVKVSKALTPMLTQNIDTYIFLLMYISRILFVATLEYAFRFQA